MRLLATIMASITLLTTALFAHALATVDEPSPPVATRVASR
jgi:Spy/CpxP family protein refolding chaperone